MFLANKLNKGGGAAGYQISRSLRFNRADAAYLNRTPTSTGSRTKFTLSLWLKLGNFDTGNDSVIWSSGDAASGNPITLLWKTFSTNYYFNITGTSTEFATTQLFRDPSAWYHVVLAVDTTQATDTNRIKLYVNGVQVTSFTTATYPAQNFTYDINTASYAAYLGCLAIGAGRSRYWDGYQTEVNFTDGSQLTPSSFGETNAQTGVWQPKTFSGTYGTNGFYVNFSDNSNTTAATLGKDYSGNGNNWTPNNFSVTAGAGNDSLVDSPTSYGTDTGVGGTVRGNYATLNALSTGITLSNGNLSATNGPAGNKSSYSTIGVSSGKWYAEAIWTTTGSTGIIGVALQGYAITDGFAGNGLYSYGYEYTANKYNNGSNTSYGATWNNGDAIGVALDLDAGTITFYKNGTSQGTAFTGLPSGTYFIGVSLNSSTTDTNFGQRPFAYTAPSGFKALCTQNLPTPTIGATTATQAGQYFTPNLWAGNDGLQTVTNNIDTTNGGGLIWFKGRNLAVSHFLVNSGSGYTKFLASNTTAAEDTYNFGFTPSTTGFSFNASSGSVNQSGYNYVAWQWKAGGSGSTNTAGSITSTVSANTTSGFSVVTYTGTGATATVGHGLGVAPSMIICKARGASSTDWAVYTQTLGIDYLLQLNLTNAAINITNKWSGTNSSVFGVNSATNVNQNTITYVAYCFAEVAGYSKFGSYTGNGASDGPFIYTGFRPAYVMIKSTSLSQPWVVKDKLRAANYNPQDGNLYPNLSNAEDTTASVYIDLLSNGFKIRGDYAGINSGTSSYIFMAFAESPQKFSLAR